MDHADDPVAAWASSGAMALTGRAGGPPLGPPGGLVERLGATGTIIARRSADVGEPLRIEPLALLGERAAMAGFGRHGDRSCGGATRLLPTAAGWLAVSLARPSDIELVPAWLGCDQRGGAEPWDVVAGAVATGDATALAADGQFLGLPVAVLPTVGVVDPAAGVTGPLTGLPVAAKRSDAAAPAALTDLVVVDLSSLWAGPLCAQLLGLGGARIVKVESASRPDGARSGPAAFFDLLHAGHESVVVDFATTAGRDALHLLVEAADVVIEGSRPRALQHLGIDANTMLRHGRVRVWLSITGYGRAGADAQKVAFGDDGAVAGGLVVWDHRGPCFCADAIADPATGLVAAASVLTALAAGGRWLLDVSLRGVAAHLAAAARPGELAVTAQPDGTVLTGDGGTVPVASPGSRRPGGIAAPLGAHTDAVLADFRRNRS